MVDSYLWGKVERISPEAPIPVVSVTRRENRLGGASNVALNIHALGGIPVVCSVIGNDENGAIFRELMHKRGMTEDGMMVHHERKTSKKSRIISNSQHLLRVDDEMTKELSPDTEKEFSIRISGIIDNHNITAVIFQDYDKGVITPGIIRSVTESASAKGIPVLVDPKKRNFNQYANVTLFKPNFRELLEGFKLEIDKSDYKGIAKTANFLHERAGIEYVMITLSESGIFISHKGSYNVIPSVIRDIADVSGAGDTVISVACLCLTSGMDAPDIAAISNIAGGLVCEKPGVVPVDKEQLLKECLVFYEKKNCCCNETKF
ncbi:MAG: D-glycero-beta-D-manno-heptose-7-phosphate kinase [Bacteroidetes bacterium]|nr:D-glycero-beta-D-manno-heptose-7-phosphate kinase [Bacteroidota bacterium]